MAFNELELLDALTGKAAFTQPTQKDVAPNANFPTNTYNVGRQLGQQVALDSLASSISYPENAGPMSQLMETLQYSQPAAEPAQEPAQDVALPTSIPVNEAMWQAYQQRVGDNRALSNQLEQEDYILNYLNMLNEGQRASQPNIQDMPLWYKLVRGLYDFYTGQNPFAPYATTVSEEQGSTAGMFGSLGNLDISQMSQEQLAELMAKTRLNTAQANLLEQKFQNPANAQFDAKDAMMQMMLVQMLRNQGLSIQQIQDELGINSQGQAQVERSPIKQKIEL